jgi:hypothetical protein
MLLLADLLLLFNAGAGAQAGLPFLTVLWPLLHGTGPAASEATDSVQATTKTRTRNFIFLKESLRPTLPEFRWALNG